MKNAEKAKRMICAAIAAAALNMPMTTFAMEEMPAETYDSDQVCSDEDVNSADELIVDDENFFADQDEPEAESKEAALFSSRAAGYSITGDCDQPIAADAWSQGARGFYEYLGDPTSAQAVRLLQDGSSYSSRDSSASVTIHPDGNDAKDPINLDNMKQALDYLIMGNDYRESEGLPRLKVNSLMMAYAQIQLYYSRDVVGHSRFFQVGENIAWGHHGRYENGPFKGWYDDEKANYLKGSGETGHYLNIAKNTSYDMTGTAFGYGSLPYGRGDAENQVFGLPIRYTSTIQQDSMSDSEYYSKFMEYYNSVKASQSAEDTSDPSQNSTQGSSTTDQTPGTSQNPSQTPGQGQPQNPNQPNQSEDPKNGEDTVDVIFKIEIGTDGKPYPAITTRPHQPSGSQNSAQSGTANSGTQTKPNATGTAGTGQTKPDTAGTSATQTKPSGTGTSGTGQTKPNPAGTSGTTQTKPNPAGTSGTTQTKPNGTSSPASGKPDGTQTKPGGTPAKPEASSGSSQNQPSGSSQNAGTSETKKNGWIKTKEGWQYWKNGQALYHGIHQVEGKEYCFDDYGIMQYGWKKKSDDKRMYFTSSGEAKIGWMKKDGSWYYFDSHGYLAQNKWVEDKGKQYFLKKGGVLEISKWIDTKDGLKYVDSAGAMKTGWAKISGSWYYFYSNGVMAKNTAKDGGTIGMDGVWTSK